MVPIVPIVVSKMNVSKGGGVPDMRTYANFNLPPPSWLILEALVFVLGEVVDSPSFIILVLPAIFHHLRQGLSWGPKTNTFWKAT